MLSELTKTPASSPEVLDRLRDLCAQRGLDGLAENLLQLGELVAVDMSTLEEELSAFYRPRSGQREEPRVEQAAHHLLAIGGKRLRPLCVALAARVGGGFGTTALQLAVAVELVHNATLLHDDVIDLASTRRGRPAARAEFGNAASIFAGDWLLIEALRRVSKADVPQVLPRLLDTIDEMIHAESLQLENRGRVSLERDLYFRIAEGKSASLFRWAMFAGGRAGGLDDRLCAGLEDFGRDLGIAFQLIDDVLDLTGSSATGKARFTDLREAKLTFPVIAGLEHEPALAKTVEEIVAEAERGEPDPRLLRRVVDSLQRTGALEEARAVAGRRVEQAITALDTLPTTEATAALALVAKSTIERNW